MASEFLNRNCTQRGCDCESNQIRSTKTFLGYSDVNNEVEVDFPKDPLPFNNDMLAAQYIISTVASDIVEAVSGTASPVSGDGTALGGSTEGSSYQVALPTIAEITTMLQRASDEAGATLTLGAGAVATTIHDGLVSALAGGGSGGPGASGLLDVLGGIAALAMFLGGLISSALGESGVVTGVHADGGGTGDDGSGSGTGDDGSGSGSGGGGGEPGGGGAAGDLRQPADKAMEFWNDLEFLYKQLDSEYNSVSPAITDVKYPMDAHFSLMCSTQYEAISQAFSTYDGYLEEIKSIHWPLGFPEISQPGEYSFEDLIETFLEKVKRYALKSITYAQMFLIIIPTLFTFDPNRTREANRRCRTLKWKIFKKISMLPTMLDLWDGIGEWTSTNNIAETIDHSQLFFETWGGYLRHSYMTPRVVRKSVARKNFTEDRILDQTSYNTANDFFQYCMSDAYLNEEFVENSAYANMVMEWDHWRNKHVFFSEDHAGVPTTTYKTQELVWVGEKLKGDAFFNTFILEIAQPFWIMYFKIMLSVPLLEYLFHKAEITTIRTYDWNTRVDFRRLAITDYRGFKRMNEFKRLDRSGLDVINNE